MEGNNITQISNYIYCSDFLTTFDIETKLLPNPYYDYPYLIMKISSQRKSVNI